MLWALTRELRTLLSLHQHLDQGQSFEHACKSQKPMIFDKRRPAYQKAIQRLPMKRLHKLLLMAQRLDLAVKGASPVPLWAGLHDLAMSMSGARGILSETPGPTGLVQIISTLPFCLKSHDVCFYTIDSSAKNACSPTSLRKKTMKTVRAYLATLLIAALVLASLPVVAAPTAPQGMDLVSTQSVLAGDRAGADRERINEILARADVQDQLLKQGVNPADVEARVAALSDAEAQQMAQQLEELPAGAGVIGALFAVFIILLITDILGLTDVYPFTR